MIAFICFLTGLLLGGCVTVCFLAAMQINRINRYEQEIFKLKQKLNME
jgi:hypothetical protein